eukprot:scaffold2160_cov144-Isochrysis_galbana.AAC.5
MASPRRMPLALAARWRHALVVEPPRPSWPGLSERDCPQTVEPEAPGADNRPTGTAGYDDPSRWDDLNAAARCQTPADLTGASGADRTGPGNPAGAKGQ